MTPLTTVRSIRSLPTAQAGQTLPVEFPAVVTWYNPSRQQLLVQQGGAGVLVKTNTSTPSLSPGDRVLVKGNTASVPPASVVASAVKFLGHGELPKPVPATFGTLIQSQLDGVLVTLRGVVQSADLDEPSAGHTPGATLHLVTEGGEVEVQLLTANPQALENLLDAKVEIAGVAGSRFDGKMQKTGVILHGMGLAAIKVLKPPTVDPWSLPLTPLDAILPAYHVNNLTHRVRVSGTITYFVPGSTLVLQSGDKSLWMKTASSAPIRIGDQAEATGFPAVSHGFLTLNGSEIRDSGTTAPVTPLAVTWQQLALSQHIFDLVSIEGRVVMQAREASRDEYVLVSEGHVFSAISPHPKTDALLEPMRQIPVGTEIRVTGICSTDNANPFGRDVPFNILLRSSDDIAVVTRPSLLTVRNLGYFTAFLLLAIVCFGARAWLIDRKMRTRLAELGYLTQRRGEILEAINKSRPLAETLERITELASFTLKGAPCWCQIADGVRLGNCPPELRSSGLRVAEHPIAAHSGPPLGSISAAFDARTKVQTDEDKALATASELATLAIETARLHSDLVHRSEFDMLTDIQNRFSFEKHLDKLVEKARQTGDAFGVIYIDLDGFKQVNDQHGHLLGDLYLQYVAERMKRQLRPGDLLARLGGDEFGVLVPVVHNRSEVAEIASRLEHCFDDRITIDGHVLQGSASFGTAVCPADADTKDGLLSIADAAMYLEKHTRYQADRSIDGEEEQELRTQSRG